MYSNFSCADLTGSSRAELMSSADSTPATTPTIPPTSLEALKQQLVDATKELQKQQDIYTSSHAIGYDQCSYSKFRGKFGIDGDYSQNQKCRDQRHISEIAASKMGTLTNTIKELNKQIEQLGTTDPTVMKAKADADAAVEQAKTAGAGTASALKIIGLSVAGLLLLVGVVWTVVKLRKK